MYERFYNLRERPFALSPDPDYLYLSRVHREALNAIRFGIESRVGFIVITGEIGAGKTTVLQTLLRRMDEHVVVARLINTILEPRELLEAIAIDFGLDPTGKSKPALLRDLAEFLVKQRLEGRTSLLVVDEAQNLTAQALEEIRLLSNLETEKSKLLQIILAGQPNLRDTIDSPVLEQLRQRITVNYHMTPLDAGDVCAYINYRLEHAALGEPPRFSADAASLIHARSGGVPRIVNVICDAALIYGYAEEERALGRSLVAEVVLELETTGILLPQQPATVQLPGSDDRRVVPQLVVPPSGQTAAAGSAGSTSEAEARRLQHVVAIQEAELARQRESVRQRERDLTLRERELLAREQRIALQQKVLGEEYRLLRKRRDAAAAPAHSGAAPDVVPAVTNDLARGPSLRQRLAQALGFETGLANVSTRRR